MRQTHHERVEVDENQAGRHDQVGHQGQRRQVLQVGREDEQDEGGQEAEHVEARVEALDQHLRLVGQVGVAVEGGGVGRLHHLFRGNESVCTGEDGPSATQEYFYRF